MPEGDTIASYAVHLREWLVGAEVLAVDCRWPRVVDGLAGTAVREVRTLGKHLLIGFSDATTLRVHLKMTGDWHRYDPGEPWWRDRGDLAVMIRTVAHEVVCFRAPDVERIDDRALAAHAVLSALGPDLMDVDADLDAAVARARAGDHARIADLLRDQRVACGLGNVYASELPFLFRVHPDAPPDSVDDPTLRALYARGGELLRANVGRVRNTTGRARPDLFVYDRGGQPCLRCRTRVRSARRDAADRPVWWCPTCQPAG